MLIEDERFDEDHPPQDLAEWRDIVIRRTAFDALELEGLSFDGVMQSCIFTSTEIYWGLFNCAAVIGTRFEACRFSGTSFRGCTFVDCEFVECTFRLDNLGGDCTIDDCLMAACWFVRCTWIKKADDVPRDITKTRWLGCTQTNCTGFDGLF
ncbi:MAG: pentapeptide repeat-containing protein [Hyphomicrobiaceae bacterium]|nr:pentapeptide repeat-containing protein [Hyphomicrobiaceae bacterium]